MAQQQLFWFVNGPNAAVVRPPSASRASWFTCLGIFASFQWPRRNAASASWHRLPHRTLD